MFGNRINKTEQRIAKNSIMLLVRMTLLMVMNLIALRFVRLGMGVEDFGVYHAIAGVVQVVVCLKSVLATASQRFLSIALGRNDFTTMRNTFHVSLRTCIIISCAILFLAETLGLWMVINKMNYPAEQFNSVMVVYQLSIFTFLCTMLQVPFLASTLAHEKMNVFAYITLIEGALTLAVAAVLPYYPLDRMILYAAGVFFISILGLFMYAYYAFRHFEETAYAPISDKTLYRKMFAFSGWTFFGSLAASLMLQGNMLLLNVFVGPFANAAFTIAITICNAVNSLGNNVVVAFRPQMTMSYSQGDYRNLNRLFWLSTASIFLMFCVVLTPIEIWMPEILKMWLGHVDNLTIFYSRIMMIVAAVLLVGAPITVIMLAVGCVKQYHLLVESIMLLCLPIGYILLKLDFSAEAVCWSVLGCVVVAHLARIERLYRYYYSRQ